MPKQLHIEVQHVPWKRKSVRTPKNNQPVCGDAGNRDAYGEIRREVVDELHSIEEQKNVAIKQK